MNPTTDLSTTDLAEVTGGANPPVNQSQLEAAQKFVANHGTDQTFDTFDKSRVGKGNVVQVRERQEDGSVRGAVYWVPFSSVNVK